MICVSIGRGRHQQVIKEHARLVEEGAKLVELRLDYIRRDVNLARLLENRDSEVVITCRRERDGGKWNRSEEDRMMILRTAIAEGVDYIDMEEDVAGVIPRFGKTKRIISHHDFNKTPDNLEDLHERLARLDADIVKIATMANNPHDNIRMLELVKNASVPTVGLCMGEIGMPTRIVGGKFGCPFTYATFHHERTLAPGQLSFHEMVNVYHYDKINAETEVYGVIADPVGHSHSPIIHNAIFRQLGMNRVYVPCRVPREHLDQFIDECPQLGIKGLSVTIPHKEAVIKKCSKVDGATAGIGAANTMVFRDGEILGFNTDYKASMECVDRAMGTSGEEGSLASKKALILGAGGVAKAIAFGLKRRGAEVKIAARSNVRAEPLAKKVGCELVPWEKRHSFAPNLLINGTPIGMHPNVDETPFSKRFLRGDMIVFDTVYNPEQTLLIKEAREKNCPVITGVEMFVRQASFQFKHFTGQEGPTDVMRDVLKRTIGPVKF